MSRRPQKQTQVHEVSPPLTPVQGQVPTQVVEEPLPLTPRSRAPVASALPASTACGSAPLARRQQGEQEGSRRGTPTFLEAIVTHTSDAMIALDEHFHILDLNAAAITTLGRSSDRAIGRHCAEILHCRNLNRMELCGTSSCPLVRVLQQRQALPNEELMIGDACEVSASVTPVEVGNNELHIIFTARDMSALKVANRVRANFVSMVSHELRTPLNSVHGFIDLLLQGHMGEMTAEQQKYLGYAGEGVQQLISIV